jgi:hypothetical protein
MLIFIDILPSTCKLSINCIEYFSRLLLELAEAPEVARYC